MELTPSQRLIFALLQDGYPHGNNELRRHLGDGLMEDNALQVQIHLLRKKINRQGYEIVCRAGGYQLVRLLHSAYDGKR